MGLGWLGAETFSGLFGVDINPVVAGAIAFAVVTFITIIFGELVPKSVAIRKAERAALFVAVPLHWFYLITRPLTWLMYISAAGVLRLFHIKPASERDLAHSEEELRMIIEASQEVGHIELHRTVNEDALQNPQRNQTSLIFFDAIDPKPKSGEFPSEIELSYKLAPSFVAPPAKKDKQLELSLHLPITTPPSQIPHLSSAGIALSPYKPSKDYSSTEPRSRALWLEFESPLNNPKDSYFVRVLGYSIG